MVKQRGGLNPLIKEKLKGLIDYSIDNYNVDENRISLTGASNGGGRAWRMALKHPTLFSSVVLVSANESDKATVYPDCPVWAITFSADGTNVHAERICNYLKNAGKKAKFDDCGQIAHDNMRKEAYTPDLINWMIQRSRLTNSSFKF